MYVSIACVLLYYQVDDKTAHKASTLVPDMFAPFIVRRQGPGALSSFAKCGSMSESKLNDSSMVLLHTSECSLARR